MPVTLRSRLLLLVMSVLLPGCVMTAWLIANTVEAERGAQQRQLRDTVRALSMEVDRELAQRAAVARVLADSRWLDNAPDLSAEQRAGFARQARRALEGLSGWVELRSADGVLLDTRPDGAVDGAASAPDRRDALATMPLVQPLQTGSRPEDAAAAVVQPVERHGRVVLNLRVTLRPQELQRIVDRQPLPPGWVGTVTDDRGTVVARHPGGPARIGASATDELRARMAKAPEGRFETASAEGRHITAYARLSPQGWFCTGTMPREPFDGLLQPAVVQVALTSLGLLALAAAGALWVASGIVGPVNTLKAAAARMQAGEPLPTGRSGIADYDDVADALADASRAVAHARSALEHRLAAAIERTRQAEQRLLQGQRAGALGGLTGGIAHDFNNLLGVISNSAHLIGRHPIAAELEMPLGATLRAVQTGSRLTQSLLRLAGRRPAGPGVVDLGRQLPEVLESIRSLLGRRIEPSLKLAPDTAPVRVDAGELELALVQLAMNACETMPRGGALQLAARNATAEDRVDFGDPSGLAPGPLVLITVSDDGAGIGPGAAADRLGPSSTPQSAGQRADLALCHVHAFITRAGGAMRLASTPGVGTTVLMLLQPAAAAPAPAWAGAAGAAPAPSTAGAHVLLVDDDEALADGTAALLQQHGMRVERARDASQALRRVAADPTINAVLTDVVMPGGIDGLALAYRLREQYPALAVVLISGFSTAAADSGFPFLRKPCPPDELLSTLSQAMNRTVQRLHAAATAVGQPGEASSR